MLPEKNYPGTNEKTTCKKELQIVYNTKSDLNIVLSMLQK